MLHFKTDSEQFQRIKSLSKHEMAHRNCSTAAIRSQTSVFSGFNSYGEASMRTSGTIRVETCITMTLWSQACSSRNTSSRKWSQWTRTLLEINSQESNTPCSRERYSQTLWCRTNLSTDIITQLVGRTERSQFYRRSSWGNQRKTNLSTKAYSSTSIHWRLQPLLGCSKHMQFKKSTRIEWCYSSNKINQ